MEAFGTSFIAIVVCVHLDGQNHVSDDHRSTGPISNLDNAVCLMAWNDMFVCLRALFIAPLSLAYTYLRPTLDLLIILLVGTEPVEAMKNKNRLL